MGKVNQGRPNGRDQGQIKGQVKRHDGRPEGRPTGREGKVGIVKSFIRDEQGGEVLEYALVAGLIVVLSLALMSAVGTKVFGKWTSLNNSL